MSTGGDNQDRRYRDKVVRRHRGDSDNLDRWIKNNLDIEGSNNNGRSDNQTRGGVIPVIKQGEE
jgi:hypothetical protein